MIVLGDQCSLMEPTLLIRIIQGWTLAKNHEIVAVDSVETYVEVPSRRRHRELRENRTEQCL